MSEIVAWMVGSDAATAAVYNAGQKEAAFDAARRWDRSITALVVAPGAPDLFNSAPPAPVAQEPDIEATHDETGRMWRGPRSALPHGYREVWSVDKSTEMQGSQVDKSPKLQDEPQPEPDALVERLRELDDKGYRAMTGPIGAEAADRIVSLQRERDALQQRVQEFGDDNEQLGVMVRDLRAELAQARRVIAAADKIRNVDADLGLNNYWRDYDAARAHAGQSE